MLKSDPTSDTMLSSQTCKYCKVGIADWKIRHRTKGTTDKSFNGRSTLNTTAHASLAICKTALYTVTSPSFQKKKKTIPINFVRQNKNLKQTHKLILSNVTKSGMFVSK